MQYVVGHLAAAAAPPRYGCALNAAASSQSQSVCSNFLEVKQSRFSYAKLFAVSGGDFNEERNNLFYVEEVVVKECSSYNTYFTFLHHDFFSWVKKKVNKSFLLPTANFAFLL